jgi:hypothetical protein
MFGDTLSFDRQMTLLGLDCLVFFFSLLAIDNSCSFTDNLRRCTFPFICAHGRPSISPLIQLSTTLSDSSTAEAPTDAPSPSDRPNYLRCKTFVRLSGDQS